MTLVPITGNAMSETPGHVLTFTAPTSRQPYDYDLAKFRTDAHQRIAKLREEYADQPARRTDVLGALAIAREELALRADQSRPPVCGRALVLYTDFIEDDGVFDFGSDAIVGPKANAGELARRLRAECCEPFPPAVHIQLIELESNELGHLSPARQHWIREFWVAYFAPLNPHWAPIQAGDH